MTKTTFMPSQSAARKLVLVDIENLSGTKPGFLSAEQIRRLTLAVRSRLRASTEDDVIVASNPGWRFALAGAWPEAQLISRPDRDGADRALVEIAGDLDLDDYSELWIVS